MNTNALILMVSVQLLVLGTTAYFFYRVLTAPHRPEPDSYSDNDDEL
jgi:cytochrome c oxidase assembly factor CtaG